MKSLLFAILCLLTAGGLMCQEARSLSLEELVAATVSRGSEARSLELGLEAAKAQLALAEARIAPSLSASGSGGGSYGFGENALAMRQAGSSAEGLAGSAQASLALASPLLKGSLNLSQSLPAAASTSPPITLAGLSLSQVLWEGYPGGSARATYEKAVLTFKAKEISTSQARARLISQAKQSYVALATAQRSLELAKRMVTKQESLVAQARLLKTLGQATELELRKAEIDAKSAELDRRSAEKDLGVARRKVAALMGAAPDTAFIAAELPEPPLPAVSADAALAVARARRGEAALISLQKRSAEIDRALVEGQQGLSSTLQGGLTVALAGGEDPGLGYSASLSLRLGLPVADGGAARAQLEGAEAQIAAFDAQALQGEASLRAEIAEAYENAIIRKERSLLSAEQASLAQARLKLVEAQRDYGAASLLDILEAQNSAAQAESARLKAVSDYILAVFSLEAAMGL